jgi:hypothetical protein
LNPRLDIAKTPFKTLFFFHFSAAENQKQGYITTILRPAPCACAWRRLGSSHSPNEGLPGAWRHLPAPPPFSALCSLIMQFKGNLQQY